MPTEIRLPELAESVTSAKLVLWVKREGDRVAAGETIAEVETDKTTVEIEAPSAGVLGAILVPAGTDAVAVGTLLSTIVEGDSSAAQAAPPVRAVPPVAEVAAPPPPKAAVSHDLEPEAHPAPSPEPAAGAEQRPGERPIVPATPLAAKMAMLAGVNLADVASESGRVTKADLEKTLPQRGRSVHAVVPRASAPTAAAAPPSSDSGAFEDRPLSAMRRVTAARLLESKQTVPHFYLEAECRVDDLMALRRQVNARNGLKITVTDLVVLAAARALQKVPVANSAWTGTSVRVFENVDIAVAVNTPRGLVTPVVRNADRKGLATISLELKELSERARQGQLKPNEYVGGTFTISNLGMFSVSSITPIINPPQSCILGVGSIESRAIVADGQVVAGHLMRCTLAADHRAIDGVEGAQLLSEIRRLLETPVAMALGV